MRIDVKSKGMLLLAVLLVLSLVVAGCGQKAPRQAGGSNGEKAAELTVVKIATASPLSGPLAPLGEAVKLGAQLAVEDNKERFKQLGVQLELFPQDDQGDAKVGIAVAQKLLTDPQVIAVMGHFMSGISIPASEIYAKENMAMISPTSTSPTLTERGLKNVFRIISRDDVQGPAAAEFAFNKLGAKKVFVIHDKTTYGQGLADEFKKAAEKLGMQVAAVEGLTIGEVDFSAVLNKVIGLKPDMVYYGGQATEGALFIKQAREKGIKAPFMGGDGFDSSDMVKIAGEYVNGVYYSSVATDVTKTPEGKAWAERYQQKFGKEMESHSVYGYDSTLAILEGLERAIKQNGGKVPTRQQVSEQMAGLKDFKGVSTTVTFDEKGDNKLAKVYFYQYQNTAYPGVLVE